ncbi:MAG: DmsC/YnfH family molybdoenzyme membrane anchor subunit [Geminicoccaceae bacterium]
MHPASSIIFFTSLSGLGFGLMMWLGSGFADTGHEAAWFLSVIAIGLAGAGLLASLFHLGNPQRSFRALSQWRSSWLSREGIAAVCAMAAFVLFTLTGGTMAWLGWISVLFALATVICTGMIYGQLAAVPRWSHPLTVPVFLLYALAGGALFAGLDLASFVLLAILWLAQIALWVDGDRRLEQSGSTPETATGLGSRGRVRLLESPHSSANYLMKEMVFRIGRKHASKLRLIALITGGILPMLFVLLARETGLAAGSAAGDRLSRGGPLPQPLALLRSGRTCGEPLLRSATSGHGVAIFRFGACRKCRMGDSRCLRADARVRVPMAWLRTRRENVSRRNRSCQTLLPSSPREGKHFEERSRNVADCGHGSLSVPTELRDSRIRAADRQDAQGHAGSRDRFAAGLRPFQHGLADGL